MGRVLRAVVVCLVLGVSTTCIIAWVCGLFCFGWGMISGGTFWGVMPGNSPQAVSRGSASANRIAGVGVDQIQLRNSLSIPQQGDEAVVNGLLTDPADRDRAAIAAALQSCARHWIRTESGWPWKALRCTFSDVDGGHGGWTFGATTGSAAPAGGGPQRVITWRPRMPGFVFNTSVFAAMWFMILFAPRMSRRALRRRRGRCERCGYDLRASPEGRCPECGALRETQKHREALPTEAPRGEVGSE